MSIRERRDCPRGSRPKGRRSGGRSKRWLSKVGVRREATKQQAAVQRTKRWMSKDDPQRWMSKDDPPQSKEHQGGRPWSTPLRYFFSHRSTSFRESEVGSHNGIIMRRSLKSKSCERYFAFGVVASCSRTMRNLWRSCIASSVHAYASQT